MTRTADARTLPNRTELVRRAEAVPKTFTPVQMFQEAVAKGVALEFGENRGSSWSANGYVFNEFRFALPEEVARAVATILGLEFIDGNYLWRDLGHHPFLCTDAAADLKHRLNNEVDHVLVTGRIRKSSLENRWECALVVDLGCKVTVET